MPLVTDQNSAYNARPIHDEVAFIERWSHYGVHYNWSVFLAPSVAAQCYLARSNKFLGDILALKTGNKSVFW